MVRLLFLLIAFLSASKLYAECDFKTGEYIQQLKDPSNVQLIQINIPKSGNYAKNFLKIAASKTRNIPPKLKKRFSGKVIVYYPFGECTFQATVRQSGDWKDHIKMADGGKPIRSLDVKLKSGNILSSINFKLLIPETRGGHNEILASLIFKRLGIISPETFSVLTEINGVQAVMLFQENARKELIEKNQNRESAIFEGDEELLWSYQNYDNFELEPLALSRLLNDNWFEKGTSAQAISLSASSKLQSSYLDYASNREERLYLILSPNSYKTDIFSNYAFILLAINGAHAMSAHNRKFYYNAITANFEPIYYDGDTDFGPLKFSEMKVDAYELIRKQFKKQISEKFLLDIQRLTSSEDLKIDFLKRLGALDIDGEQFFDNAIFHFKSNILHISNLISEMHDPSLETPDYNKNYEAFLEFQDKISINQNIIVDIQKTDEGYLAMFQSGKIAVLTVEQVSKVLSDNTLDGYRTVLLSGKNIIDNRKVTQLNLIDLSMELVTSPGIEVNVSSQEKLLYLTQTDQDDWALLKSGNLKGWTVKFYGIKKSSDAKLLTDQRFNEYGLTGCLTFYDIHFNNANIEVEGGVCEDSVNLISSTGFVDQLSVTDAFADAVDIDFSDVEFSKIDIQSAGNDCIDVSGGTYKIKFINLFDCGDKGISVGEASYFASKYMEASKTSIGISSKDLSVVNIIDAYIESDDYCVESMQKKQEFGGAFIEIEKFKCEGMMNVDKNSNFKIGL